MRNLVLLTAFAALPCFGTVYYKETFENLDGWVVSDWKQDSGEAGVMELSAGAWTADPKNMGYKTTQDAKFYAVSSKMTPFSNTGKTLVVQFSVKHEQGIDCGGGYIKLMPKIDQKNFQGETEYAIMFGPDICGSGTKRVHVIFNNKGENLLIDKTIRCEDDKFTHVYTLIVNPDNTYEVRIDGEKKQSGNMKDDWNFELPKEIKDPEASKPSDWVDDAMIDDPEDAKPEGYDDIPETIVDDDAVKPDDWDDEEDGEWEAPQIPNPDYKGEWKPKRIENPDYKGPWEHPMIANPDYVDVGDVYERGEMSYVGFEIWQVKSGTIFDNIIITDSVEEAEAFMKETFDAEAEKEAEKKYTEAKAAAEEAARAAEAEAEEEEDSDETDEDEEADMADLDAPAEDDKDEL